MPSPASDSQIESATGYQKLLVPALMEEWAPRVADAARIGPGDRVLDVACGTGVLARAAAHRASASGTVTGLDLNLGMIALAARLSPELRWHQGSANALPFPDASFDAVISQFGLMFFPDRPAALREMMRVLVPGGRLAVAVWASLADTPAYDAEVSLVERLAGARAAELLREPFVLGDRAQLAGLLEASADGSGAARRGDRGDLQPGGGRFAAVPRQGRRGREVRFAGGRSDGDKTVGQLQPTGVVAE